MLAGIRLRPDRALLDPTGKQRDLFRAKPFTFRRHHFVGIRRLHARDQPAGGGMAGSDDRRLGFAALHRGGFQIQPQITLLLVRPVAFGAALDQDGLDVPLEIDGGAVGRPAGEPFYLQQHGTDGDRHQSTQQRFHPTEFEEMKAVHYAMSFSITCP